MGDVQTLFGSNPSVSRTASSVSEEKIEASVHDFAAFKTKKAPR